MNDKWQATSLSECLSLVIDYRGKTPKKLGAEWSNSGYRAISANNVKSTGLDKTESIKFVDESLYKLWMKEEIKKGDILLTSEAPSGQVMLWDSDEKIVLSQRLFGLRVNNNIYNRYLKYYLQSPVGQKEIFRNNSGSTVAGISAKTFSNIVVWHPEYESQRKIGDCLYSIDKKIDYNHNINSQLNNLCKTFYDFWFVQFDFPDSSGKPYKSSGGQMVFNEELGFEIPIGWQSSKLSSWIKADKSGDWGSDVQTPSHSLQVNCIRGADINGLNGLNEFIPPTRYISIKNNHKILNSHDLIIEISGGSPSQSTGRLAYVTDETMNRFHNPLICSNFCKAITLKNQKLLYNFSFHWNTLYENDVFFDHEGKTSGIKNLLFDSFINSHYAVCPEMSVAERFYDFVKTVEQLKQNLLHQNLYLSELRDWLMKLLLNGQVKVD